MRKYKVASFRVHHYMIDDRNWKICNTVPEDLYDTLI